MRIGIDAIFEDPSLPTGAVGYMINLLRCLGRLDHDNEYFVFISEACRNLYEFQQDNFHWIPCWASNERRALRIAAQQVQIPRLIRKFAIDVFNSPANVAPLLLPCRSVLTIKTMHHIHFARALGWKRAWFRRAMVYASAHAADCIIANSISNRDDIVRYLRVSPDKVVIVHEAVDKGQFRADLPQEEVRTKLDEKGVRPPFILNVSSIWPYKNQGNIVRAFGRLVREKNIPHQLVLAGGSDHPEYVSEVHRAIVQQGVADRVHFVGYLPHAEIAYLYRGCDVFVYPSFFETFGLTLLEAMACGAPIVCSDRGSLPEILGGAGLTVVPESAEEIAGAIYRILSDKSLRDSLVQRGFRRVQDFSWEKTAAATRDVYLQVGREGHARLAVV